MPTAAAPNVEDLCISTTSSPHFGPTPRLDDDDEDDDEQPDKAEAKKHGPVAMLIQRKFLQQRKIFLWGAVTDETAKDITEKLLYLEVDAPGRDITFYINSPGGSITAGMAYDTMQSSRRRHRGGDRMAASMAHPLRGAAKGRRLLSHPGAHSPAADFAG